MQPALTISKEDENRAPLRSRKKKRLPISFILAGVAILGAVIYLVVANTQANASYYMTIAELHHCTNCTSQSVRVAGFVQAGSIVRNDQTQIMRFAITDKGLTLPVAYSGVVPDIFRPGIEVVVEGHYQGYGAFEAQTLLAKCPSKFQAATPSP